MNRRTTGLIRAGAAISLALIGAIAGIPALPGATATVSPPGGGGTAVASPSLVGALPAAVEVAPGFDPSPRTTSLGPLPSVFPLAVAVGLASKDPDGLATWDSAAGVPGTPEFHHPLSPSQAARRFGAGAASVAAAERYFAGYGLATSVAPDGLLVYVDGPSSAIARAFGTSFLRYRLADGRTVFSHPSPAELPPVAPWTGAIGLGNVTPIVPPVAGSSVPVAPSPSAACAAGSAGLLPCTIETAYNITPLLSDGIDGAGERIAVVDAYSGNEGQEQLESDLSAFVAKAGIPLGSVDYYYPVRATGSLNTSGTNPGWALEDALDLEWTRGIAPGATIEMTFSPNPGPGLYAAINWIVARGAADVISLSWGEPDVGVYDAYSTPCSSGCNASSDGSYAILDPVLELAAAEGISVFAASGDCGAADGTSGVSTNFPASDPYVTGVGGTVLTVSDGKYSSETGWSGNESGAASPGCVNDGGSGGGYSPFPRPWWQTGVPAGTTKRGVPDVAMDADTAVEIEYRGNLAGVIGTSVATPIWAGITAIADQYAGVDLGLLNPSLYRILGSDRYATDFHDITSGNNGYLARVGWDPVTGVGSPIVDELVVDLARGGGLAGGGLATSVTATPAAGDAPLTVTFKISATGGSGTYPLEGVSFGDSNSTVSTTGSAEYTYEDPGVYLAQSFVFDSGGNSSVSAPVPVVVGGGTSLGLSLKVSTDAPATCGAVTFTASVTGGTGPYSYGFWFGDGASAAGLTTDSTTYDYPTPGVYSAVAEVTDSADPVDGGTSPAVEITVGGASGSVCGSASPFVVSPEPSPPVRDAPADFPGLFTLSGGTSGPGHPAPTVSLSSGDPYTAACDCTILRSPGNYTVTETAVDSAGAKANATDHVTVAPALAATFTASPLAGPVPLRVAFTAAVSGGYRATASATAWTFGPAGATGVGAYMNWTYTTPGEYLATAVVGDSGFGNASESFLIDAEPSSGPVPLGATGTISPSRSIAAGSTVHFAATVVGSTYPVAVFWDLGGAYGAAGPFANETYFAPPPDDVLDLKLVLEGPEWTPQATVPLELADLMAMETGGFVPAASALSESAVTSATVGLVPLRVNGTATASGPGGTSVRWQAAGGTASDLPYVNATFHVVGNFTLAAEASDAFGDTAVVGFRVVVTPPFRLVGGPVPGNGTVPLRVEFHVGLTGGSGSGYEFAWNFGNGDGSSAAQPTVTYSTPGRYTVTLRAIDALNESFEKNWTITVTVPVAFPVAVLIVGAGVGVALAVVLGRSRRRKAPSPVSP